MGIALQTLLNRQSQALHAAAHVRVPGGDPDPDAARYRDIVGSEHRGPAPTPQRRHSSTLTACRHRARSRSRRGVSGLVSPLGLQSIGRFRPLRRHLHRHKAGPPETTVARRARRRHVNTKLVAMPCRRAISVTTAPGASVSSMIRILSSRDQRRRRSTPPRTSTRIYRP